MVEKRLCGLPTVLMLLLYRLDVIDICVKVRVFVIVEASERGKVLPASAYPIRGPQDWF